MLKNVLVFLGVCSVVFIIFLFGIGVGASETPQEKFEKQTQDSYRSDLFDLSTNYGKLYALCEQKYQLGIEGDYNGAFQVKGQMTEIESVINKILVKYKQNTAL